MKVFALLDKKRGYCYNNEDIAGCDYDFNIDEYTILFRDISTAKSNVSINEEIVELEIEDDFYSEYLI